MVTLSQKPSEWTSASAWWPALAKFNFGQPKGENADRRKPRGYKALYLIARCSGFGEGRKRIGNAWDHLAWGLRLSLWGSRR
jgi:hypothetical protein